MKNSEKNIFLYLSILLIYLLAIKCSESLKNSTIKKLFLSSRVVY